MNVQHSDEYPNESSERLQLQEFHLFGALISHHEVSEVIWPAARLDSSVFHDSEGMSSMGPRHDHSTEYVLHFVKQRAKHNDFSVLRE